MSDLDEVGGWMLEVGGALSGRYTRVVLAGQEVSGAEGVHGLRLVANCLWQAFEADGTVLPVDPPPPAPTGKLARQLARIKTRLRRVMKRAPVPAIVCYHLDGTGQYNLALSPGLSIDDAWEILTGHLQSGMDLEVVA